ncbi:hypothetical protein N7532_002740 [Penicillium argentinense]|uniref:Uncharacterized protein n=1 Tax=Penicillium argentinense TaxID=1131581 RepID=A0A9W9G0Y3_9EURO|nr:uncharacterized protein N7532_002740 [Penicillium argentinense]KAJ5110095.1 hypothetical protein N7532_002740 [Penicillium argentinense]
MDVIHPEGSIKRIIERKRLEFVSNILMIGCDFQSTLGIAYMITVFSQASIMDTYHLHLVFDIVSFVGVSNTAALVCWRFCRAKMKQPDTNKRPSERITYLHNRYRATFIFTALYLALTILLCIRLNQWAPKQEPGRCYFSHMVTSDSGSHPGSDKVYVAITSSWLILVMLFGVFGGVNKRRTILILASLHFPLHLYMAIALRQANQGKFEGEMKHENEWDFGQTTAVLLLVIALIELVIKWKEYYEFESDLAKHGLTRRPTSDLLQKDEEANETIANSYLLGTPTRARQASEERQPGAGDDTSH